MLQWNLIELYIIWVMIAMYSGVYVPNKKIKQTFECSYIFYMGVK